MPYRYATDNANYEDYAAGRVLLTGHGATSFPVRLASEVFQHCMAALPDLTAARLYDPCCGGGYLLAVLGFLHGAQISTITASDLDVARAALARRNLALLTPAGLAQREHAIQDMIARFGKDSHRESLASVDRLRGQLPEQPIPYEAWAADALTCTLAPGSVDILLTDVPYNGLTTWAGTGDADPISQLLEAQRPVLSRPGTAAIISDKKQRAAHPGYKRVKMFTLGKRRVTLLQPL